MKMQYVFLVFIVGWVFGTVNTIVGWEPPDIGPEVRKRVLFELTSNRCICGDGLLEAVHRCAEAVQP